MDVSDPWRDIRIVSSRGTKTGTRRRGPRALWWIRFLFRRPGLGSRRFTLWRVGGEGPRDFSNRPPRRMNPEGLIPLCKWTTGVIRDVRLRVLNWFLRSLNPLTRD